MEPLWSPVVATGSNQRQLSGPPKPQKEAKSVATGCHRLPEKFHGKEGVCRGLPPVARGPLPAKEGVDTDRRSLRLLLVAALRAWALVATAAGACLADHGSILPGSSFGRLCSRGSVATP